MKQGFIILAIVVLIMLYVLSKTQAAQRLKVTVGVPDPKEISGKGGALSFILPIRIQNPTGTAIRLKGVDFDVNSAGKYLGNALLTQSVSLAANQTTTLLVRVTLSYLDLLAAAGSILNIFKGGKANLELDGTIYAEGFQLPYKTNFDFDIPKL